MAHEPTGEAPPAPPGPPPAPRPPRSPAVRALAWIGAAALLAVLAGLAGLASTDGDADGARIAGAVVGSLAFALAIAALIRWLVVRNDPHERVWAPSLLLIACGVALLPVIGAVSQGEEEREAIAECERDEDAAARFRALPTEMVAEPLDAATEAQLNEEFSKEAGATGAKLEARRVTMDGAVLGVGMVVPLGESEEAREEFKHGVTSASSESGAAPPEDVDLGSAGEGFEVSIGPEGTAGRMVFAFAGCQAVAGVAEDGQAARQIAEALASAQP